MILAGLLLMVLAGLVIAAGVMGGTGTAYLTFGDRSLRLDSNELFLLGVGSAVVLMLGFWMIKAGIARGMARRREAKELAERNRQLEASRQAEIAHQEKARAQAAKAQAEADSQVGTDPQSPSA